ncbi:MAG: MFS transporter [Deltaproteobacteria bacterium]|nr:MFS transporter [Deltaproteobacteria bacterium]
MTRALKQYYFCYFAAVGLIEPFLTLYWRQLGLSGPQIGVLYSVTPATAIVAPWVLGYLADRTRRQWELLLATSLVSAVLFAVLAWPAGFWPIFALIIPYAVAKTPLLPFVNSLTFAHLAHDRSAYGRLRVWGSVGYIVTAVVLGSLMERATTGIIFLGGALAYLGCTVIALRMRPSERQRTEGGVAPIAWQDLAAFRPLIPFFVGCLIIAASGGALRNFFGIDLTAKGGSTGLVGLSWAIGVAAEVIVMLQGPRLLSRFGARGLLLAGCLATAIRWTLYAVLTEPLLIVAVSPLHALTFASFYLGAIDHLEQQTPAALRTTGQGLFSAMTFGVGGTLGNLLSGWLFEPLGMPILYLVSAAIAVVGTAVLALSVSPAREVVGRPHAARTAGSLRP